MMDFLLLLLLKLYSLFQHEATAHPAGLYSSDESHPKTQWSFGQDVCFARRVLWLLVARLCRP